MTITYVQYAQLTDFIQQSTAEEETDWEAVADCRLWFLTWQQRILLLRVHWDKQYIFEILGHDNIRFAEDTEESHVQKKKEKGKQKKEVWRTHTHKRSLPSSASYG